MERVDDPHHVRRIARRRWHSHRRGSHRAACGIEHERGPPDVPRGARHLGARRVREVGRANVPQSRARDRQPHDTIRVGRERQIRHWYVALGECTPGVHVRIRDGAPVRNNSYRERISGPRRRGIAQRNELDGVTGRAAERARTRRSHFHERLGEFRRTHDDAVPVQRLTRVLIGEIRCAFEPQIACKCVAAHAARGRRQRERDDALARTGWPVLDDERFTRHRESSQRLVGGGIRAEDASISDAIHRHGRLAHGKLRPDHRTGDDGSPARELKGVGDDPEVVRGQRRGGQQQSGNDERGTDAAECGSDHRSSGRGE